MMRSQRALLNVWEVINGYCWGKQLYEFLYCHISSMWVLCYFLFSSLVILSKTHKTERACGLIIRRRKEVSYMDRASAWIEKPPGNKVDCSMVTKKPRAGQHLNCLSKRERRSWEQVRVWGEALGAKREGGRQFESPNRGSFIILGPQKARDTDWQGGEEKGEWFSRPTEGGGGMMAALHVAKPISYFQIRLLYKKTTATKPLWFSSILSCQGLRSEKVLSQSHDGDFSSRTFG